MRKVVGFSLAMLLVLGMAGTALAVPLYYTFEGTVSSVFDDAGIIANAGLSLDSAVQYTFLVDFDIDGTYLNSDGTTYTYTDTGGNMVVDYFHTDYICGSALEEKDGAYLNGDNSIAEYNIGVSRDGWKWAGYYPMYYKKYSTYAELKGNSNVNEIRIYSNSYTVAEWGVGMSGLNALNTAYDSQGVPSSILADLTLTSISETAPDCGGSAVPEPGTMMLLGSGLLGIIGFRKKD